MGIGLCPSALFDHVFSDLEQSGLLDDDNLAEYRRSDLSVCQVQSQEVQRFAAKTLLRTLLEKLTPESSKVADEAALNKFLRVNHACKTAWEARWAAMSSDERCVFDYARGLIARWLEPGANVTLSQAAISDKAYFGPGASLGTDGTSVYEKVSGALCASTEYLAHCYASDMRASSSSIAGAELRRSERHGPVTVKNVSRLSFVPKKADVSRSICIEPAVNTYYQLGASVLLKDAFRRAVGIHFPTQQDRNRRLARLASQSGQYFTLDLSSASDSMSLSMMKALWPRSTFGWLNLLRTPKCVLPGGEIIDLHMLGTMGNGSTSIVQTITFCSLLLASYQYLELPIVFPKYDRPGSHLNQDGNFGVFGDDCIGLAKAFDLFSRVLTKIGFNVNADKTFLASGFNESCGGDFFHGCPVRGVYVKSLSTVSDVYSAFNRLSLWSAHHAIPLGRSLSYLLRCLRPRMRNWIPPCDDVEAGLFGPPPHPWGRYVYVMRVERKAVIALTDLAADSRWCRDAFAATYLSGCFTPGGDLEGEESASRRASLLRRRLQTEKRQWRDLVVKTSSWPHVQLTWPLSASAAIAWNASLHSLMAV